VKGIIVAVEKRTNVLTSTNVNTTPTFPTTLSNNTEVTPVFVKLILSGHFIYYFMWNLLFYRITSWYLCWYSDSSASLTGLEDYVITIKTEMLAHNAVL